MSVRQHYGAGYVEAGSASEEDNMHSTSGSEDNSKSDFEIKARRPCCCCCTAERFYHISYVMLFFAYLVAFPLWAKWLMCAPMPYKYWHEELDRWPLLPAEKTYLAMGKEHGIGVSAVPMDPDSCNYSCGESYMGFRTNLMNFEVKLSLTSNQSSLQKEDIDTMYPVLLASEDFDHWVLVGDRRHAYPEPFFRSRSKSTGQVYVHKTDQCMSMPAPNDTFTSQGTYIIGCVTWTVAGQEALSKLTSVTKEDLSMHCNSVGGVCGWPCGSRIPSTLMEGCSADGIIDTDTFAKHVPSAKNGSKVSVYACYKPDPELMDSCTLSTKPMSAWPCHECQQKLDEAAAESVRSEGETGSGKSGDDDDDDDDDDSWSLRRRRLDDGVDDPPVNKRFVSLPQLEVRVYDSEVPPGTDIFNTPRVFIFAAHSLDGPFKRLYSDTNIKNLPLDDEQPETPIQIGGGLLNTMRLERMNDLTIRSDSCFGKRGPLYIVACAVNQSIYDDTGRWYPQEPRFQLGQEVKGPPFNDRCIAVGGSCGYACTPHPTDNLGQYCTANGTIKMEYLTGDIDVEYNQTKAVLAFVVVLLCGFSVKILMLFPGIFSPYKRAHDYDPEMTENFRYLVVASPMATSDDNKGAMLRNVVGSVACMPPDCRCRYHVVVNDEGHRNEMKTCWQLFCKIIEAVPNYGGDSYERNVLELTKVWCSETRMMGLPQIGGKVAQLDDKVLERLCGRTALRKLLKESRWRNWNQAHLAELESAMELLANDLRTDYNKFTVSTPYLDILADWEPRDASSLPLRIHYSSRAKPVEDPRNIMVQHVAVGSWYYKVPKGATTEDWLALRTRPKEMVYALPDHDDDFINVPLRSSHGKAGGLNFVDNYMTVVARRPQNIYGDERDEAPSLFAVIEGQHQFQPDFMLSCLPCFFRENGNLDERVSFTQAPPHYPELSEKTDYMDCNNAQFFRLTSMIRNCCGGVSSCGTNGMWMIPPREEDQIWIRRPKRVRDQDKKRREHLIEREFFHTGSKIEDTATTIDSVLIGRHSHFVNRKLSFGMAKPPTEFIGAQQRCVEGAVTLGLQWLSNTSESRERARRNRWLLWATAIGFAVFLGAMISLVISNNSSGALVEYGVVSAERVDSIDTGILQDIVGKYVAKQALEWFGLNFGLEVLMNMFWTFIILTVSTVSVFVIMFFPTMCAKCFTRFFRCSFPNELRWWARLVISVDNVTYFIWFWTSFFWIGFNYYLALAKVNFHFHNVGMMTFMLVVNLLNFGMLVCNSMRYTVMASVDANEVAALSMDTIWRSNQLFFMTGPIQLFAVISGISEFIKYKFYGQDIGGWTDVDLGKTCVRIVKYWTVMMLLGDILVWTCYFVYAKDYPSSFAACVVVTLFSLDVLHPCVFLWFGHVTLNPHELAKMTCCQCLCSPRWWKATIKSIVLEGAVSTFLKYLPLAYFLCLPFLALWNSYFGLLGSYVLVAMGPAH